MVVMSTQKCFLPSPNSNRIRRHCWEEFHIHTQIVCNVSMKKFGKTNKKPAILWYILRTVIGKVVCFPVYTKAVNQRR